METGDLWILGWGRVLERILIVGFAGLSMILGWNLFVRGVVLDQEAEGQFKDWKLALRKVGPGTFFALFGAVVLATSLLRPLQLGKEIAVLGLGPKPVDSLNFSYLAKDEASAKRTIRAINAFINIMPDKIEIKDGPVTMEDLRRAQLELRRLRYNLLLSRFTSDQLDACTKYCDQFSIEPGRVPVDLREHVGLVRPWFDETIAMENN